MYDIVHMDNFVGFANVFSANVKMLVLRKTATSDRLGSKRPTPTDIITSLVITALIGLIVAPAVIAAPVALTNPGLEQSNNGLPTCYQQAGWGDNNATWALSNDTHSGNAAQSVTVINYASGDRKLMMTENASCAPAVIAGASYQLSAWYKSTGDKNSLTVFRHSVAGWTYWTELASLPATAIWAQANGNTPIVPAGTDQISFGISISANGTLTTDDYYVGQVGAIPTPTPVVTQLSGNNSLEAGTTATPDGWMLAGWGDAKVTAAISPDAHTGIKAYSINMANRTQGDFKLLPTEATSPVVQPGVIYELSAWYKSTTASNSITVFAHTASGWGYYTDIQTLPATAAWTNVTAQTPPIPAGIDAIAWGVTIYGNGTLVTDDYSTVKLAEATAPATVGPEAEGQWTVLDYNLPIRAVHSTVLKNGKVLLIAGSGNDANAFAAGTFKATVWDPIANTFTTLNVPKDMFCAGHVTLPDGRILIQGGSKSYPTTANGADYGGLRDSWIFNPDTNTFLATNLANEGHWYPTLTELGNGDIMLVGGLKENTTGAVNTELFDHTTGQWKTTGIPQTYSFWGLYPHMFLMQDGRLFYSGAHVFGNGLPGSGASIYDFNKATIADVPGLRSKDMRDQAASVLLPPAQDQKVLITGGGNINTNDVGINTTDIIDLKQANPQYMAGPDMPGMGKMYVNATTLPDRTVLTTNGGQLNRDNATNVMTAADYDPATNKWTSVAADPIGRNYHSSAVLLPDGRVAVIGSNPGDGGYELRISVYKPKYLFKTVRPTITNAPTTATYGSAFTFKVNAPGKTVKWVQLMRPMSVTHQMDSNMRLVDLPVAVQNGNATVNVTANRNLLPPGPYMLGVTDSDGVPSIATWVTIQ